MKVGTCSQINEYMMIIIIYIQGHSLTPRFEAKFHMEPPWDAGMKNRSNVQGHNDQSKRIRNDQELIQSDPTSCPQIQKGNN